MKYRRRTVKVSAEEYRSNGTLAVALNYSDGERDIITTNLQCPLQTKNTAFLDTNNYPGIDRWVEKQGLGLPLGYTKRSGFCEYPLYTIFTNQLS